MDLGDHLHMLITFKPALSIEQVVRRLKMLTTHKPQTPEPAALGRNYLGAKKRLWSGDYFASTIGHADTAATITYIRNLAKQRNGRT